MVKIHRNDSFKLNNTSKTFADNAPRPSGSYYGKRSPKVINKLMPLSGWLY